MTLLAITYGTTASDTAYTTRAASSINVTPVVVFIRRYKSNIIDAATIEPPMGSKKRIRAKVSNVKKPASSLTMQAQARIIGMMECGASNGGFCLALKS